MELIGRQFGHIRVTEVVGQGGMGAVYAGHDRKLDRKVALKVLHADQRLDEQARERLLREARALSKVDHPNICRIHDYIETGDVDLLVLEYIDGRTLQAVIEYGLPHPEKLRIALAVAEVLVRAHRAGIVHRDLKPDNVMLTKTGEVKVLDFGLARWLHRKSDMHVTAPRGAGDGEPNVLEPSISSTIAFQAARPSDVSPTGRRELLATAAGTALGTPIYMSPEQARGENLTPASDMFSFGLLLQVLFTGREPHHEVMSAREVILRVARGETNPVQGAPKDITALINQLKMYAPADRPTAVQTVERLRFQINKPQRIARRSIAAGVAGMMLFGGWRYTVDLDRERSIALAAQAEAIEQRAKAEDLIGFMLGDLRKKLEPIGRLEVLDEVGERALTYVNELEPETTGAIELARNSKALNQLVEVRIAQGNLKDALDLAERSLRLTSIAARKAPDDPEVRLAHGTSHFWVGNVQRLQGNLPAALQRMKTYSAITQKLATEFPADETYQVESAYGHSNMASMLEATGKLAEAVPEHQLTLSIKAGRVAAKPADRDRQADLALTLNKIGVVLMRLGELDAARRHFEREAKTYEGLLTLDPQNRTWKDRLGRSLGYAAATLEFVGDIPTASILVDRELTILSELHAFDRTNALWKRSLAMAQVHRGWLLLETGDPHGALKYLGLAATAMQDLVARDPKARIWRRDLAMLLASRGQAHLAAGNRDMALRSVESAEQTMAGDAVDPFTYGQVKLTRGNVLSARGDQAGAINAWTEAASIFEKLPTIGTELRQQDLYARTLLRLGQADRAAPFLARLDDVGYRHPDFVADRRRFERASTHRSGEGRDQVLPVVSQ